MKDKIQAKLIIENVPKLNRAEFLVWINEIAKELRTADLEYYMKKVTWKLYK